MSKNVLLDKSYAFSLKVVKLHIELCNKTKYVYPLSLQLVKSGTSIGANIEEAIGGYSERDFTAKLSISYKEARETRYWLRLLGDSNIIDLTLQRDLLKDSEELIRILGAIIRTIKAKQKINKTD